MHSGGGALLTSNIDVNKQWKEYFSDLLSPIIMTSTKKAELSDLGVDMSINRAEVGSQGSLKSPQQQGLING